MTHWQQFQKIGNKQLVFQQAVEFLEEVESELRLHQAGAKFFADVEFWLSVAALIPNLIINASSGGAAKSLKQLTIKMTYEAVAIFNSPFGQQPKFMLHALQKKFAAELTHKKMGDYIPVVNILLGFVEDVLAILEASQRKLNVDKESSMQLWQIQSNISSAKRELVQLGIRRGLHIDAMQRRARTA